MRILFTSRHYLPSLGGLQESSHQLALRLAGRGHHVAVLAEVVDHRSVRVLAARLVRKAVRRPVLLRDRGLGYPVFRTNTPDDSLPSLVRRFSPDVIVAHVGGRTTLDFSRAVLRSNPRKPVVVYVRDSEGVSLAAEPHTGIDRVIANASVHAERLRELGRESVVIPSVVETDDYLTASTRQTVLYINPSPRKGLEVAWEIAARCPEIPFVFLEAWSFRPDAFDDLRDRARELGNVEIRRAVADRRRIYSDARILLAPYIDDNRPRVVAEAQANGIPVLALRSGGLIESVGSGGILLAPDATGLDWADALRRLWDDRATYDACVRSALEHSRREEMQPDHITRQVEDELTRLVTASSASTSMRQTGRGDGPGATARR